MPQLAEGLAARRLSAQELHDLLLAAGSRGQASVRYVTITGGVVVAVLPHHDSIQEGTHVGAPGRAATTKDDMHRLLPYWLSWRGDRSAGDLLSSDA